MTEWMDQWIIDFLIDWPMIGWINEWTIFFMSRNELMTFHDGNMDWMVINYHNL